MGEVVDPFHGLCRFHYDERNVIDLNLDMGACRKASTDVGGFKFHMGDRTAPLGDVDDGSGISSHGIEAFFQLSDAAKAFCNTGDDATDAFLEEDWVSPRISLSQDLTMEEKASRSSRGFAEKRKWQNSKSGEDDDGCSSEFEFLKDDAILGSNSRSTEDLILSADELFLDGKLLPLHSSQHAASSSEIHGEISVCRSKRGMQGCQVQMQNVGKTHQNTIDEKVDPLQTEKAAMSAAASSNGVRLEKTKLTILGDYGSKAHQNTIDEKFDPLQTEKAAMSAATSFNGARAQKTKLKILGDDGSNLPGERPKLPARHLSLDLRKPVASACVHTMDPLASFSVDKSLRSPPRQMSSVPSFSLVAPKAISKQALRIRDLFKLRMVSSSSNPHLTRDNSTAAMATCRIPLPPRAFWRFSRSKSAGEFKSTHQPPPKLPPRSNSASESAISRASPACQSSNEAQLLQACSSSSPSPAQDARIITRGEDAENSAKRRDVRSSNLIGEISNHACDEEESVENTAASTAANDGTKPDASGKGRASRGTGHASRKRYATTTTSNFLRGSPSRRGGSSSFARMNSRRRVLRNLERCDAERKLWQESSSSSRCTTAMTYPATLRVSPVINVAVYRGRIPAASGLFDLRSLFSSKRGKAKENNPPLNNWRTSAF